jgi:hypothetical protein
MTLFSKYAKGYFETLFHQYIEGIKKDFGGECSSEIAKETLIKKIQTMLCGNETSTVLLWHPLLYEALRECRIPQSGEVTMDTALSDEYWNLLYIAVKEYLETLKEETVERVSTGSFFIAL